MPQSMIAQTYHRCQQLHTNTGKPFIAVMAKDFRQFAMWLRDHIEPDPEKVGKYFYARDVQSVRGLRCCGMIYVGPVYERDDFKELEQAVRARVRSSDAYPV